MAALTENDSLASIPIAFPVTNAGFDTCPRSVGRLFTAELWAATLCVSDIPNNAAAS